MAKDRRKLINMHSSLSDKQPTPESLEAGEIAVNNYAGNEFLSTKNSNDEVVRFSADGTMIDWMEKKAVFPYQGTVTNVNDVDNSSQLQINLNQSVAANTPHHGDVNDAEGGDTAKFMINMSKYAMIGANPSFSSITVNNDATFEGDVNFGGNVEFGGDGSNFTIDAETVCMNATDMSIGGSNSTNVGHNCDGETSTTTSVVGSDVDVNGTNDVTVGGTNTTTIGEDAEGNTSQTTVVKGVELTVSGKTVNIEGTDEIHMEAPTIVVSGDAVTISGSSESGVTIGPNVTIEGSFTLPEGEPINLGDPSDGNVYVRRNHEWETSLIQHGNGSAAAIKSNDVYISGIGSYNGSNEDSAQTLQEVLTQMNEHIYNAHASVSLNLSPNIIERDVTTAITVRNSVQFLGSSYTPQAISVRVGSTSGSEISTTPNGSVTANTSATTTYYATVTFIDGVTKTATAKVSAYYPMYFGGSTATSLNSAAVLAMAKQRIKSSPNGSYNVSVGQGQYMWLCVPNEMTIYSVTSSGFGVPMEAAATVAVDGKGNYSCYRSSSTYNAGNVSIVIS